MALYLEATGNLVLDERKRSKNNSPVRSCDRKSWDSLPEELFVEILCRLPIKSILRCTSIRRSWYYLIKNPHFINTHLKKTKISSCLSDDDNNYFLFKYHYWENQSNHYSLYIDNYEFKEFKLPEIPFDLNHNYYAVGSCNGLICLASDTFRFQRNRHNVILWNPLIGKSQLLPLPNPMFDSSEDFNLFHGFGFDSKTNDFKVLRIRSPWYFLKTQFRATLYSLKSNSWKDITHIASKYNVNRYVSSVFVNNALHWIVNNERGDHATRKLMVVFNLSREVFHEISFPEFLQDEFSRVCSLEVYQKSSISVIFEDRYRKHEFQIWGMKEYGDKESWMKLANVGKEWRGPSRVLGFRNNGEVLILFGSRRLRLASQKLNQQRIKKLRSLPHSRLSDSNSIVGSLFLLDKGNDLGDEGQVRIGS